MPSNMESLYKLQNDTKLRIDKARSNTKKSPKERITRSYVEIRLETLESLWNSFVRVHEDIVQEVTDLNKEDKYFKNDIYENTEELHVTYKCELKEMFSRFDNKRFTSNCLLKRLMSQINAAESSSAIKGLLDTTMECLNGLKNLGVDVESWDIIVIYIVSSKLDVESRKLWETKISAHDKLPTLLEFREFLEARSRALEFLDSKSTKPRAPISKPKVHHIVSTDNNANVNMSCPYCKESHKIANCKQFAKESYESRHDFVQTKGLCFNCLGSNHSIKYCRHNSSCQVCKRRHHSLLHPKSSSNPAVSNKNPIATAEVKSAVSAIQTALSEGEPSSPNIAAHFSQGSVPTQVLLATALVEAQTRHGSTQLLRVLLDQGSQASFITEST
ncbi:Uncharacterized protein OBRU01_09978, partial [Operophtera brumata]